MEWTKEQEKVISTRDKNILVSAAAGSGKTAVLVERIMQIVINRENPVDIDKLLVVTFTRAAAAEMKERILKAFEKALDELCEDDEFMREHLEKQCTYIHSAKISTIDSFCTDVIKENISLTDIDPAFRIGDNSELVLMQEDALSIVLDRWYEDADPMFMEFVETYCDKVEDDSIERLVERLYKYASSYPEPREWIKNCGEQYNISSVEEWKESKVAQFIKEEIKNEVETLLPQMQWALEQCDEAYGLQNYAKAFLLDVEFLQKLNETGEIEELLNIIREFTPARLGKTSLTNEEMKARVSNIRSVYKSRLEMLKDSYCNGPLALLVNNIKNCKPIVDVLVQLTLEYDDEFRRIKKEKNVLDFSDIEHYALQILTEKRDGKYVQTEAAKEMAEDFYEIMIDEYQDSNHVQEVLLNAVSKESMGKKNVFMVGDVKQSIYKFRMAKPELFLEKYNRYPAEDISDEMKIVLAKNFRSRQEVVDSSNLVFSQIMTKELGGIVYDEKSMLYKGAEYEDTEQNQAAELILVDKSKNPIGYTGQYVLTGNGEKDIDDDELTKLEAEAVVVANRIKEMMNPDKPFMVKDKATGNMRPAKYSDIVLLFRTKVGTMDVYLDVLTGKGIPASSAVKESMLDTFEINVILDFLRIIDNPRQDIPLVSVLKHVFGYTEDRLSVIKCEGDKNSFYDSFLVYEGDESDQNKEIIEMIDKYRHFATYMPIYRLIKVIIEETGFVDFVSAMKNGEQRLYNIDMFIEKAEGYAKGVYTGLFNFIRYIEKVKKHNADRNEDAVLSDEDNTVKFMSIHKSKGLEFPIVFVVALGKKFNKFDKSANVVMHSGLGIGVDEVDLNSRLKYKTAVKQMISKKIEEENYAEEIRVLYVALTRAKEKLILVASGDISSKIKKLYQVSYERRLGISKSMLMSSESFVDMIIMAMMRHESFSNIRKLLGETKEMPEDIATLPGKYDVTLLNMENVVYGMVQDTVINSEKKENLLNWDSNKVYSDEIRAKLNERFSYVYKYENDTRIRAKHSVSDIKHAKMEIDEFAENKMHTSQDDEEYIPEFIKEKLDVENGDMVETTNGGALRGSAVHRFFELFDYDREAYEMVDIREMMGQIQSRQMMTDEELELVNPNIFVKFMKNGLGKRMQAAHKNKLLFRERPFVMGMTAREVDEAYDSDELVVVQGIIDAFFYENDEVVIVDYKTDNVEHIEELVSRYKAQLDCYADAIRKVTGKNVKEKIIYSTKFSDIICV